MRRSEIFWSLVVALLLGLGVVVVAGLLLAEPDEPQTKWRTHYETVDRTVPGPERTIPGPERTVFKKRPGVTTWIIVCGENTQRVEGNKPITECNLPDTGGGG